MPTQPPVMDETPETTDHTTEAPAKRARAAAKEKAPRAARPPLGQVLRELDWLTLLVVGLGLGALWIFVIVDGGPLQILAGLLPVTAGILVGRRVQRHIVWHAVLLSLIATIAAAVAGAIILSTRQVLAEETAQILFIAILTLPIFPALGVITASRSEQRLRAAREENEKRGGRLDRPGRVRSIDDLRALSLPQLGGYVADLFRKHGFLINDYRFEKERLDFQVSYEGEPWLLRVTTAEKVKPGFAQELAQRMKAEGVKKGVVITSMDFQEGAARWAKDKPIVLLDGPTLLSMND
ncbi:MAG TPA: restriction endonuclease [Herpetosiphonaceae bacterium]